MNTAKLIISSMDSVGRVINSENFERGIKELSDGFGDDGLSMMMYLTDEGMNEDWAEDIIYKYVQL